MRFKYLHPFFFLSFFFIFSYPNTIQAEDDQYYLTIGAIFRDDAPYLEEWIEFHQLVGVEHFILYNHCSKDNFLEVLTPYIEKGVVELFDWPYEFSPQEHEQWVLIQCNAYNEIIEKNRNRCRWIAFLDTDEFLFPMKEDHLADFMKKYEQFGGVCVSWRLFGTSHVPKILEGELLIEKLILTGPNNYHVLNKSIVQPRCVDKFVQMHSCLYSPPYFHVNPRKNRLLENLMRSNNSRDLICINHYWTRDENYFNNQKLACRKNRGWPVDADVKKAQIINQYRNHSISRFITPLRERMKKKWEGRERVSLSK